jgi:ActD protein
MSHESGVLAIFAEPAGAAGAVQGLRDAGFRDVRVAMPAPFPELMAAIGEPRSVVGRGVLLSTFLGVIGGFALCILTALSWPLVTGGKPIVSLPAFTVIAFEISVLVGGTATHAMLAYTTVTGRWRRRVPVKDPRFSTDRIGLFVVGDSPAIEELLRTAGAEELRRVP